MNHSLPYAIIDRQGKMGQSRREPIHADPLGDLLPGPPWIRNPETDDGTCTLFNHHKTRIPSPHPESKIPKSQIPTLLMIQLDRLAAQALN